MNDVLSVKCEDIRAMAEEASEEMAVVVEMLIEADAEVCSE